MNSLAHDERGELKPHPSKARRSDRARRRGSTMLVEPAAGLRSAAASRRRIRRANNVVESVPEQIAEHVASVHPL